MVFKQTPLYRFLEHCIKEDGNKVLDCGAGGDMPPLSMFYKRGFRTCGIELDKKQLQRARLFGDMLNQNLNIQEGDIRALPFEDESFDFVYSYNSVFNMKKDEIKQVIREMKRVLKPNGLLFVNFLSIQDSKCGSGTDLGNNQYEQKDYEAAIRSFFDYDEADILFADMTFVTKEQRLLEYMEHGKKKKQGYIDYIYRK